VNIHNIKVKVKLSIVNRLSHSSVTDASGAHLRFQGPETAECSRRLTCRMGSHSIITSHPIPCVMYWRRPDLQINNCRNLPGGEAGANLYCLVNTSTRVWTTCPKSLPGSAPARSRTCNLMVTSLARYRYTTQPNIHNVLRQEFANVSVLPPTFVNHNAEDICRHKMQTKVADFKKIICTHSSAINITA